MMNTMEGLRLDRLVVATPDGRSRGVNLTVGPGRLLTVGPERSEAGAVEATASAMMLARVVVGLVAPRSGRIHVDDRDVTDLPPEQRKIGYVPAGGALLPQWTVWQNIAYGLRATDIPEPEAHGRVSTAVKGLELGSTRDVRPHLLTDAQRLRVALARAAVSLPSVLVVELPTLVSGAERLNDLAVLAMPLDEPRGPAVLVCTDDPNVPDEILPRVP
ncbi:MAG: ATP-binding cassette domain-containing protein [Micromonosporaceae bacterium]|nr:ATP-binding cassette domain-containing protein [Micromonosporaceae bacterium]